MRVNIIGAGIAGLASAALLAAREHEVHVYEKNEAPGGKMSKIRLGDFRFDTGPSLLTMPFVLENLFAECGRDIKDYLEMTSIDPVCRYFWKDGSVFNCYDDIQKTCDEIRLLAPDDIHAYPKFLDYTQQLYEKTADAFLFNPLQSWRDFLGLKFTDLLNIDALTTVSKRIDSKFSSPYLRQFFKRFTTYNGSSPYQAPATLNVIPHVELNLGGYYVKGGLYRIALALEKLAVELGARFHYKRDVKSIIIHNKIATGITLTDGTVCPADAILSNADAAETYLQLLNPEETGKKQRKKIYKTEPSCSGFVLLLGIKKQFPKLAHHNIFFSENYEQEFDDIFNQKIMPGDPTIYIANTSFSDSGHAPFGGINLFILINAPYLSENFNWELHAENYADFIISELEKRGLSGLNESIIEKKVITPQDFYLRYRSNKGSIYGTSSNNRFAAFARPRNQSKTITNLYLAGGSTHPGGGIPLCVLSARHAVTLIERNNA